MAYNGKKNIVSVPLLFLFYVGILCQISYATNSSEVGKNRRSSDEYLLIQITSLSARPGYYLFDPKQKNATLCAFTQIEESNREAWMPEQCPAELIAEARRLSNNLTDPSSELHSAFSSHGLHHVQIMKNGYLYRHPKRKHCIYWVEVKTGEETPYYCTGMADEILQFVTSISEYSDFLEMTLPISSDSLVVRKVDVRDNEDRGMEFPDEFQIHCGAIGNLLCAVLNGSIPFSNLPFRYDKACNRCGSNVGAERLNNTACFQAPKLSSRSQVARLDNDERKYILAIAGGCNGEILELNETDEKYRVVWQASQDFYSQEHHVSFTVLTRQEGRRNPPLERMRNDACISCTKSCLQVTASDEQFACPYTVVELLKDVDEDEDAYYPIVMRFVVYDESWELPLFGREQLESTTADAVDLGTGKRSRQVSNMAARNRNDSLCWTYHGNGTVRCRNILQEQNPATVLGKIYPLSTMLVFGLNGREMFYNDGNCGQVYLFSFRFNEEYRFPPYSGQDDLSCDSRDFVLDTESKILFWVANNTVSAHVLFDGTSGIRKINVTATEEEEASNDVTHSIAADMARREVYTLSSYFTLCKISYDKILDAAKPPRRADCETVDLTYWKVSQLQVWGDHLFGLTGGIRNSLGLYDTSKGLLNIALQGMFKRVEVVDLLHLRAAAADAELDWTYITNGLELKNNSASFNVSDSFSNPNIIAPVEFEERVDRTTFRRLIFLSPTKRAGLAVNPCANSRCVDSFCFLRFPLKEEIVCVCPKKMKLKHGAVCIAKEEDDRNDPNNLDWVIPVAISVSVMLFVTVCVVSFFLYRSSRQNAELRRIVDDIHKGDPEAEASAQTMADKVMHQPLTCTIASKDLIVDRKTVLGEGNFGLVLKGTYKVMDVAIKTPKSPVNHTFLADMVKEAKIMNYIGDHPHIVKMYGAEVSQVEQGKMFIALEFSPFGCLLSKLQKMDRNTCPQSTPASSMTSNNYQNSCMETAFVTREKLFLDWAEQIANGMHYLSTKNVFHGDLATRNILVFHDDVLKISDFGLSRRLSNYSNYTKGNQTPLPWRWMAFESLTRLEFSIKSDVWAYGVTLWEIFTSGDLPYSNKTWNEEFVNGLASNEVLPRPAHASQSTYERLMRPCWILKPEERPDFAQILDILSEL